jgi:hypothetical protein
MSEFNSHTVSLLRTLCLVFFLLWVLFPCQLQAATINVGPDETHKTIQSALNDAQTGDTIFVEIGTYAENIVLPDGITIEGEETAGTKIIGTGINGDTVTITGNSAISYMTIINTVTGSAAISVSSNVAGVSVTNNLIIGSKTGTGSAALFMSSNVTGLNVTNNLIIGSNTGIQCPASSNIMIINNVIDRNTTGIICTGPTTITFENNIVSNNTIGINFSTSVTGVIDFNDVYNNGSNLYTPTGNDIHSDPKFADPTVNDYHLQTGSACLDAGDPSTSDPAKFDDKEVSTDHTRNDCGAYGGPNRDVTPFQVQNVVPTAPVPDRIDLQWNANLAYDIADYNVYFDDKSHTVTSNIPSPPYPSNPPSDPLTIPATITNCPPGPTPLVCTTPISGLAISAPRNLTVQFGDQKLFLNWSPPANGFAASYNVYYGVSGTGIFTQISLGNTASYTLTGLTNLTVYDVKVTAIEATTYFINVTALDDCTTINHCQNGPHESSFIDPAITPISVTITCTKPACESDPSMGTGRPEPLAPFPDLPDQGHCFIATAAYGSAWEPQVRILRSFRDEYLEQYDLGREFVAWYYHTSPPWARYLNEHPWLKPVVRAGLLPAVGIAYLYVKTSGVERLFIFLTTMLGLSAVIFAMRKVKRSRG